MEKNTYEINGITYCLSLSLEQDELLSVISNQMLIDCPESLSNTNEALAELKEKSNDQQNPKAHLVASIAMDMLRVQTWLYKNQYVRRILAILLVPEGAEFDEKDIPAREIIMKKYATREVAAEVVNYFFMRSGAFAIGTAAFSR